MNRLILGLALIFATGASGQGPELRLGVILSATGLAAEDGKTLARSLELAAEDLAKETGTKVKLLLEDDGTQSKNAVTCFQKLAAAKPDAIIGATWDFTSNPLMPLAAHHKIVLFNTTTIPESLDTKSADGFGFVNAISVEQEAEPFARLIRDFKGKRMVAIYANNSWGETQLRTYKRIARDSGIAVVDELKPSTYDENEWRDILPRVKAKEADLVLLLLNKNDLKVFVRRAREIALPAKLFASKNAFDAYRADPSPELFEGMCFTYPLERVKALKDFGRRYRERFGEEARIYADNTYDSLFLIERAWQLARAKAVSLKDALLTVSYRGLAGEYRFDPIRSFSTGSSSLVCVEGGSLQVSQ